MPPLPTDPSVPAPCANGVGSDNNGGTGSSEGFTAFFTSTEKSQSSDSSDRKSHNKSTDSKLLKATASSAAEAIAAVKEPGEAPCFEKNVDCADESDSSSSSMIVLARVKRKHQRRLHVEGDGESNGSSGQPDGNDASPNRAGKDQNEVIQRHNPPPPNEARESSSSSSSDSNAHVNVGHEGRHNFQQHHDGTGQVHIVSETNTASNTSGSGSGGNSGSNSGTNSGSGSNGSGNENPGSSGSGNEGKGSSDDAVAKDDNSGGDGNPEPFAVDVEKLETNVHRTSLAGDEFSQEDEMSRENRLLDKKRKRMNMRREYEEQVQQDLDSEDSPEEVEIRPGKPVTLDAVLSFTKIARYENKAVLSFAKVANLTFIRVVVQSTPPFLVVHANAAFTALTGIDSHAIIGKPIRTILSVPESKRGLMLTEFDHSDGVHSGQSSMTNSATANRQLDQAGSTQEHTQEAHRQQYEGSSGILHYEAAAAAGHARANSHEAVEVNVERLVAASGYGQVHVLHVSAKPHHMLGRNVTVFREPHRGTEHNRDARQGEHGSNGSSLASNDAPFQFMACRIGVSPVVSSSQGIDLLSPQVVADHENSNKRRKHHHQHPHRRHQRTSLVTHFCIQLEKAVPTSPENPQRPSSGALPHSMAIRKIPDGQDRAEPHVALNHEVDELSTQSSDLREPVTAIG